MTDGEGRTHCSFLVGKARVAPLKTVTIPRLELTAATVAVRLDAQIKRELEIEVDSSVFWTDSTVVLPIHRQQNKSVPSICSQQSSSDP